MTERPYRMTTVPPPDPDAFLLQQLAVARRRDDGGLSAGLVIAELLQRHVGAIDQRIRWKTHAWKPSREDRDEIANGVLLRLARTLENKTEFETAFRYVVAANVDWEVVDVVRRRKRHDAETLRETDDLPEVPEAEPATLAAQARDFAAQIETLPARDRRILTERFFVGTPIEEIADMLEMSRGAVDTATHRALRRLFTPDGKAA